MDVAQMSMNMSSAETLHGVTIAMAKKTMDMVEQQTDALIDMAQASQPTPPTDTVAINRRV